MNTRDRLTWTVRVGLGVLFVAASLHKIVAPAEFARSIANYQLLPAALVPVSAVVLPWVELACGLLLVAGRLTLGAAAVVDLLMLVFMLAFGSTLLRGIDVSCGCFTSDVAQRSEPYLVMLRDASILAGGVWVLRETARRQPPERVEAR